jgi:hypothetical protein
MTESSTRERRRLVKVDASDPKAVAQTRALIRLLYKFNGSKSPLRQIRKNVRFHELEMVFVRCWRGLELPDDDAGRADLFIAACHLWHLGKKCGPIAAIKAWATHWAPWCGPDELAELIKRVEADPRKWSADELAHELGLHVMPFAVRQALGLTTIGSIDVDKDARERRRTANQKENSTAWRRRHGAVPRADYLAKAASQAKPWLALGISERTYYRRKAREAQGGTSPYTPKEGNQLLYTDLCHDIEGQSVKHPADSRGASSARRRALPVLNGEIIVDRPGDVARRAPPPTSHT